MKRNLSKTVHDSVKEKVEVKWDTLTKASAPIRMPKQRPISHKKPEKSHQVQQVTREWNEEATHTDRAASYLPTEEARAKSLAPKRIQRFQQRKAAMLLKKLVEMQQSARQKLGRKVLAQHEEDPEKKLDLQREELWRDMLKPHEERQFQIGRITNYFTS